jgi:hypothetical protein
MKRGISTLFIEGEHFRKEFKRQVRTLILFTLGFTIAFTWRQTIFDVSLNIVKLLTHVQSSAGLSILSSIFITLFSLGVIFLTTHWLKDENIHS